MSPIRIQPCTIAEQPGWLELRQALWPDDSNTHRTAMQALIANPHRFAQFIAYSSAGEAVGFAEVSLRSDYVNGTTSSPVAFLEGIYVLPSFRQQGVARLLFLEVDRWARASGCRELASDALIGNEISHAMHLALGFIETERVVYFRKSLD